MTILVTGGSGFIGSHLLDSLQLLDFDVIVIDDGSTGFPDRSAAQGIPTLVGSINDVDFVNDTVGSFGFDCIVHLAAQSSLLRSKTDPIGTIKTNVLGTAVLLEAARKYHVRQVIFASTGAVYDYTADRATSFIETDLTYPNSVYGASKLAGEHLVRAWSAANQRISTILRFGNVFGPRQVPIGENQLIPRAIRGFLGLDAFAVYGDGKHIRDYVYVTDVVSAIKAAFVLSQPGTFNVGSGKGRSTWEVALQIARILDYQEEIPTIEPPGPENKCIVLETSRAQQALDWTPTVKFPDGLRRTVSWVLSGEGRSVAENLH